MCGAGTAYPPGTPDFNPYFIGPCVLCFLFFLGLFALDCCFDVIGFFLCFFIFLTTWSILICDFLLSRSGNICLSETSCRKTIKLVFVASLLTLQHEEVRANTCCIGIRIMCPCGAECLSSVDKNVLVSYRENIIIISSKVNFFFIMVDIAESCSFWR